jgi:hypothetical protein
VKVKAAVSGVKELAASLGKTQKQTLTAIGAGLYSVANEIRRVAIPITPLDFGNLRSTIYVEPPTVQVGKVTCEIGAGGTAAPYALIVHEAPPWWKWQEPGTGPKFLERAVEIVGKQAGTIIAKTARAHLQGRSFFTGKFSKGGIKGFKKGATDWLKNTQKKQSQAKLTAGKSITKEMKQLMKPKKGRK